MQSILQYRRFGNLAENQLATDPEKGLRPWQQPTFRRIKHFSANETDPGDSLSGDGVSVVSSQNAPPHLDEHNETHDEEKVSISSSMDRLNASVTTKPSEDNDSDITKAIVVEFEPTYDPMNPRDWSFGKRLMVTIVVSFMGVIVGWSSSIDSGIIPQYAEEFGVSEVVASLSTGVFQCSFRLYSKLTGDH